MEPVYSGHPWAENIWPYNIRQVAGINCSVFGVSLSEPHIDRDNGPHAWNDDRVNYLNSHYMYIRSLLSAQLTPLRRCLTQQTVATCKCKRQREQLAATSFQKATASD